MVPRARKIPWHRRLARGLAAGLALLVALTWGLVLSLRWLDPPVTSFMLQDTSGRAPVLYEWVPWSDLGLAAALAVVAAEDQRFAQHFGVDLESVREALAARRAGKPLRGASTITQQVAKNLFLWPARSFLRKGIEAYFALLIEVSWPKQRILEMYLNIVQVGPGIYGMGAASQFFFARPAAQLTDPQAALLAAVLPNPTRLRADQPTAYLRERQGWIVSQMQRLRREQWWLLLE